MAGRDRELNVLFDVHRKPNTMHVRNVQRRRRRCCAVCLAVAIIPTRCSATIPTAKHWPEQADAGASNDGAESCDADDEFWSPPIIIDGADGDGGDS